MNARRIQRLLVALTAALAISFPTAVATAQNVLASPAGPDPREIPCPPITTSMGRLPGVGELSVHKEMPDVMAMNDGTRVTTIDQWKRRRQEMKRILECYAVGQMKRERRFDQLPPETDPPVPSPSTAK